MWHKHLLIVWCFPPSSTRISSAPNSYLFGPQTSLFNNQCNQRKVLTTLMILDHTNLFLYPCSISSFTVTVSAPLALDALASPTNTFPSDISTGSFLFLSSNRRNCPYNSKYCTNHNEQPINTLLPNWKMRTKQLQMCGRRENHAYDNSADQTDQRAQKRKRRDEHRHAKRRHNQRKLDQSIRHLHDPLGLHERCHNLLHPQRQREHVERELRKHRDDHEPRQQFHRPGRIYLGRVMEGNCDLVRYGGSENVVSAGGHRGAASQDQYEGVGDHLFESLRRLHGVVDGGDDGVAREAECDQAVSNR
mmetsp:Transcript_18009/g.32570  ORF Transcript_18009/g.32570 Transcript_18009/m.32570 type:complete len:305 (-) Transcript_18009:66-980(-)